MPKKPQAKIADELVREAPDLFQGLNKTERARVMGALALVEERTLSIKHERLSHSGPIPDPDTLSNYDAIIPNGAERIMAMAESQSEHRQKLESDVIKHQISLAERGQIFAMALAVIFALVGCYALSLDHEVVAGAIFGVNITGLVTVFIVGKKSEKKELENKQ